MFNLAIDSKLRGCDVVAINVDDVAAGGYTADRATVRQKKTGRPVRFKLTEKTRQAVDEYLSGPPTRSPASPCSQAVGDPKKASRLLLGHTKIESTVRYLGIEVGDAMAIAEQFDV